MAKETKGDPVTDAELWLKSRQAQFATYAPASDERPEKSGGAPIPPPGRSTEQTLGDPIQLMKETK